MCFAGASALAVFVVLLSSGLPQTHHLIISDCGLIAAGLTTAASCSYRARHSGTRRRRAWRFFTGAGLAAMLGNMWILGIHLMSANPELVPASAPLFYLALMLGVAGMAAFPAMPRRGTDLARMILDSLIIGLALFTIASVWVFPQLLKSPSGTALPLAIAEVTVATVAALLYLRVGASDRPALAFVAGGCVLYAVFDLYAAVVTATHGSFSYGSATDVGWMAGYLLIALAAQHPATVATASSEQPKEASPAAGTVLVFTLLTVAAVCSMSGVQTQTFKVGSAALWLVMLLSVAGRQVLLILDNDKLRHGLERRVDERTNELRDATRRSELLLSSVGEGIYGVDPAGFVTFVNPAGASTLGLTPEELVGKQAHGTFHAVRDDGTPFPLEECYITEAIRDGTVTLAEGDSYLRANGTRFPVEVTATPLARDDVVQGAVVVFRDVTQRLEVDRMKSEFVSMVSHELRTPLTSIRGSLGLLAGGALGPLPAPAIRLVDVALESCARLTRLINDILDIERIESGTMPMEIADHDAAALIDAATSQLQLIATQVDVELVVSHADGVVFADADRAVQTLINLVDNAIKFSPRQTIVDVSSSVQGDLVEFCIRDHGRGIPYDKLDSIFSRFEQVDSSDAREKGGSGLGLAISRSVVERLGGRIWAESTEGNGATFRFTLPRAVHHAVETEPELPFHELRGPGPRLPAELQETSDDRAATHADPSLERHPSSDHHQPPDHELSPDHDRAAAGLP